MKWPSVLSVFIALCIVLAAMAWRTAIEQAQFKAIRDMIDQRSDTRNRQFGHINKALHRIGDKEGADISDDDLIPPGATTNP